METYWERRRNNQEDHSLRKTKSSDEKEVEGGESDVNGRGRNSFSSVGSNPTTSDSLSNERPTKKNSQKENKKHPYKNKKK